MEQKRAGIADVPDISRIHAQSWKSAYKGIIPQAYLDDLKEDFWVAAFDGWISNNLLTVQLMVDEQCPVGCIAYGKSRDEALPGWGEIVSIYLLPEYFGKGVGELLLQSAIKDMKNMGFEKIYLWVLEENLRAQKFYQKCGFSFTDDKISFEIAGKQLVDVRFVYPIK